MVDLVSDSLNDAGDAQITIVVFALPPNDSWRILVSFESLDNQMKNEIIHNIISLKLYLSIHFLWAKLFFIEITCKECETYFHLQVQRWRYPGQTEICWCFLLHLTQNLQHLSCLPVVKKCKTFKKQNFLFFGKK